jgi:DNA-binding response OmpR family regulator
VATILLIEDDAGIRSAMTRALTDLGHAVTTSVRGMPGLESAVPPDVVLLDLGLPDLDGLQVLAMLRAVSEVPVIIITARDDDADIVKALDGGADDYVVKPFGVEQVDARLRVVLRRSGSAVAEGPLVVGGLTIDPRTRQVSLDGAPIDLSRKEFDLLLALAQRPGEVVTRAGCPSASARTRRDVRAGRSPQPLADRIGELLTAEREAVADLSHRLRTTVTGLRLDAEAVADPELADRLRDHIGHLERTVDAVAKDARRPVRNTLGRSCDASSVVRDRVAFWSALAADQDCNLTVDIPPTPTPAAIDASEGALV